MKVIFYLSIFLTCWSQNNESIHIDTDTNNLLKTTEKSNFEGVWINLNEERPAITKCKISFKNNNFIVQMWGSCQPQDCDWGENIANGVEESANKFELLWNKVSFAESTITYELNDGKLKMTNKRRFKDNSGRPDYTIIEYFKKE